MEGYKDDPKVYYKRWRDSHKESLRVYNRAYYKKKNKGKVLQRIKLSEDEIGYIREHSEDMYPREIAQYIGCSDTTVTNAIKRLGLPKYKGVGKRWKRESAMALIGLYNGGEDLWKIADRYGMKPTSVASCAHYVGRIYNVRIKRIYKKTNEQGEDNT